MDQPQSKTAKNRSTAQLENVYIVSGSTHPRLAEETALAMGVPLGEIERKRFPNTEQYVRYGESVRGRHVFAIQTLAAVNSYSVNDSLMELVLMIDAAKRASASEITVVAPYMAYLRQDRKARGREPISAAVVINMLQRAGATRLVSIDMHSAQTQGNFDGPFDHLIAELLLLDALRAQIKGNPEEYVVLSPDAGRAKLSEHYANELGLDIGHIPKKRDRSDPSKILRPANIPEASGRTCIIVDDMIDTAGTLVSAAAALQQSGAKRIIAAATHGLFSEPALERLAKAPIELLVTDSVPVDAAQAALGERLHVVPIAPLLARALCEISSHGSVSALFHDRNYQ